jgi:antitoxin (DNA-binding transcriptional repressor) of toxin-antitoxin stability system
LRQFGATGESVIVTDHGKPAFEVRPYRIIEPNPLDVLRGSVLRYESLTDPIAEGDWKAAQQLVQSFVDEQKS